MPLFVKKYWQKSTKCIQMCIDSLARSGTVCGEGVSLEPSWWLHRTAPRKSAKQWPRMNMVGMSGAMQIRNLGIEKIHVFDIGNLHKTWKSPPSTYRTNDWGEHGCQTLRVCNRTTSHFAKGRMAKQGPPNTPANPAVSISQLRPIKSWKSSNSIHDSWSTESRMFQACPVISRVARPSLDTILQISRRFKEHAR